MILLPINKQWFDMIAGGEKKEEYREIKPYWTSRFNKIFDREKVFHHEMGKMAYQFILKNGYAKNAPTLKIMAAISIGTGRPERGAEPEKLYFVLHIRQIIGAI